MTFASLVLIVGAVGLLGYGLLNGSNLYLAASIIASLVAALALVVGSRRNGKAVVAAAVEAEAARGKRRSREEKLVGAGVGGTGRGGSVADDFADYGDAAFDDEDDDDVEPARNHETALLDVGRRGVPAQSQGGADAAPADEYAGGYGAGYGAARDEFGSTEPGYQGNEYASQSVGQTGTFAAVADDDDDDADADDPSDEPPIQRVASADAARVAQLTNDVIVIDGRPRYHQAGCVHLLGRDHEPLPVSEAVELGFTPCGLCEPDSALLANARRV